MASSIGGSGFCADLPWAARLLIQGIPLDILRGRAPLRRAEFFCLGVQLVPLNYWKFLML